MRILGVILLLTACAQTRYLSADEDASMRFMCEESGCVTMPEPTWKAIEKFLHSLGVRI